MALLAHELKASYAFIERNFYLTRRYWGWEIAFLVYSVAGALSISLIGADQGNPELLLTLMVGAIFWNYLSVVFSWIAETVQVERWEGTLEYTFMAPVRRWSQLLGSVSYAMVYGLVHTAVIFIVLSVLEGGPFAGMTPFTIGLGALIAVWSTIIAFITFLRGVEVLGAVRAAILSTSEPFFTAVYALVILSQPLPGTTLAGGALIVCAILLLERKTPPTPDAPSPA